MRSDNRANMVNLCSLLLKYNNFSQVEDDIFLYIDRILENTFEIHKKQTEASKQLAALEEQIAEKQKRLHTSVNLCHSPSPVKKRKVQSLDSSHTACKENVSSLEDSTFFPHKSDSDVSSKLDQNILDSDEPFFALTQTPPTPAQPAREVLSPRNEPSPKASIVRAAKLLFVDEIKSPKKLAAESFPAVDRKPIVPSAVTPTSTSKWTGKKCKEKPESSNSAEHTPTGLKRFHSLAVGSNQRFRQGKLNFPRQNKHSPRNEPEHVVNDTMLSDFVVPTPPSVANKSKFLRSLRMKKQSTLISKGQSDRSATMESSVVKAHSTAGEENKSALLQHDETDDINQTYCPGVESINRIVKDISVKIKQELVSQPEKQLAAIKRTDYVTNQHQQSSNEHSISNEIILIPPPSQQSIVTVVESQNENNEFITELHNEQTKRTKETAGLGMSSTLSNNVQRTNTEFGGPSDGINHLYNRNIEQLREAFCNDCMKLYKYYIARGVSNDAARTKLPRHCRSCRLALLHETPSGFWDPDFLPTPQ
ncbi:uncharacterized protein LOC125770452 [Anopheles funestus]|uniref:uncharacterized protein LOC125770452 n=1 Tax=Anopheles funestus TaxID=62324 RepID=UPI0020C6352A|nr:uncharacterized protein LOC125770452 [Anopheles funestus]XP_049296072.1 uncharacterized protein LOC125770452 [Anopheles funestus]